MSYTPTNWANGKAPALNATNLNKIENELVKLDNDVTMLDGELTNLENEMANLESEVVKPDIATTDQTTMPNSHDGRLLVEEIGGVCEQVTYSGKNLLNPTLQITTSNGVTCTNNGDGTYTIKGTATGRPWFDIGTVSLKANKTYKICGTPKNVTQNGGTYLEGVENYIDYGNGFVYTPTEDTAKKVYISIGVGESITNAVFKPMVTEVLDATYETFEPYTGGASPNPSYPQEIRHVRGKNLLDCSSLVEKTVHSVKFTPVYDSNGNLLYVEANGTATANAFYYLTTDLNLPNGDYCLNGYPSATNIVGVEYYVADANAKTYGTNNASDTVFTVADNGAFQVFIIIKSGYTATNLRFYPMIRKATIADNTYVPYGLLRVKTHGKNLFDISKLILDRYMDVDGSAMVNNSWVLSDYMQIKNSNIVVSHKDNAFFQVVLAQYDKHKNFVRTIGKSNIASYLLFELDEGTAYIRMSYSVKVNGATVQREEVMVNEGTSPLPYEPYKESSITLSKPIDLYGIGDVQDVIAPQKICRKLTKKRITSAMDISRTAGWGEGSFSVQNFFFDGLNITDYATKTNMLCTHAKIGVPASVADGSTANAIAHGGGVALYINFDNCTTVDELKTFLDKNEVYVYYQLAEEVTEELPLADQIALNSLATYDGITYLEFDSEIEPTFEGEYGTSKVGGYTLEGMLAGRNGELYGKSYADRVTALEATVVNNI